MLPWDKIYTIFGTTNRKRNIIVGATDGSIALGTSDRETSIAVDATDRETRYYRWVKYVF